MKKYDVLIKEYDYFVIAINTVYNTSDILDDVESDLKEYKFNGYYIFDFLLKCVNIDSIDRMIAYKVIDGKVSYKEKFLIIENKNQIIKHMNDYYSNIDVTLLESSLLNEKSKRILRNSNSEKND